MNTTPLPPLSARPGEEPALAVLASDAGIEEKARACQQLTVFGSAKAIPALAGLLDNEQLAAHARSGLENMKDAAAGEALRAALPKLNGSLLAGVVTSLGVRREASAVNDLIKLIHQPDRGAAEAALAALGKIANAEAIATIRETLAKGPAALRVPAAHAAHAAARRLDRSSASALMEAVRAADVPEHIKKVAVING